MRYLRPYLEWEDLLDYSSESDASSRKRGNGPKDGLVSRSLEDIWDRLSFRSRDVDFPNSEPTSLRRSNQRNRRGYHGRKPAKENPYFPRDSHIDCIRVRDLRVALKDLSAYKHGAVQHIATAADVLRVIRGAVEEVRENRAAINAEATRLQLIVKDLESRKAEIVDEKQKYFEMRKELLQINHEQANTRAENASDAGTQISPEDIEELQRRLEEAEKLLSAREKRVRVHEQQVMEKEREFSEEIKAKRRELDLRERSGATMRQDLTQYERNLVDLEKQLSQREAQVSSRETELRRRMEEKENREENMEQVQRRPRDVHYTSFDAHLWQVHEEMKLLERQEGDLKRRRQKIMDETAELDSKAADLEHKRIVVQRHETDLRRRAALLRKLQPELDEWEKWVWKTLLTDEPPSGGARLAQKYVWQGAATDTLHDDWIVNLAQMPSIALDPHVHSSARENRSSVPNPSRSKILLDSERVPTRLEPEEELRQDSCSSQANDERQSRESPPHASQPRRPTPSLRFVEDFPIPVHGMHSAPSEKNRPTHSSTPTIPQSPTPASPVREFRRTSMSGAHHRGLHDRGSAMQHAGLHKRLRGISDSPLRRLEVGDGNRRTAPTMTDDRFGTPPRDLDLLSGPVQLSALMDDVNRQGQLNYSPHIDVRGPTSLRGMLIP